ncbi:ABC transporter ATP-binding protein [Halobium palmae]|uniref:ABC-type D-xylose/L-arabinose transporter n=1 Tax=Halobium palmae TaxID=1776492 RepID=A0ABD5RVY6_9EURY
MTVGINGLTKIFEGPEGGEIVAVDDLDIDMEEGEFVVFVGPSGCGKTTTLRCIAGLESPTSGEITLNGEEITYEEPQNRNIAMVFQNYALYPHLTVRRNIGFGLKNRTDLSKEEIDERVDEVAELMGISDLLEKNPADLSGGQQQRVATGRAIVRDPEVFLFDEPLSNLDAKLRKHMRTEIQRLQEQFGTTSIYVTHDQEEAMTMADRIVVLNDGELQQIGAPTDVYNNPANRFVASFVGEPAMNFFDVKHENGRVEHEHFALEISDEMAEMLAGTEELVMGVRPEDLEVADDGIDMKLEVLEELGSDNLLYLSFGDDEMYIVETKPTVEPDVGETVTVRIREENLYFFDDQTGQTIVANKYDRRQSRAESVEQ